MGEKNVSTTTGDEQMRHFTKAVLADLQALERMFRDGLLESDAPRIGAEQEMFIIDSSFHPAPHALEIIESSGDPRLTTEIGRFNIEANLTPLDFRGDCLRRLEIELDEVVGVVRAAAANYGSDAVLSGILPTIQLSDLGEKNLTPLARYKELNRVLTALHGDQRIVHIKGLDEIKLHLHDTFTEFCNTSFQIHLQVPNDDFARYYNWAQAISAPVLATAVNSPLLMGHRLWQETRLALFQHSTDERSPVQQERSRPARVTFGRDWVRGSILDIFHEDVARFRIILTREVEENSLAMLDAGRIPALSAWRMHNGTVWRWNRACYGVTDGRPALRVEARFLPSGPTVADEMANSALFLGLMTALPEEFGDVTKLMTFDDAKTNFFSAAMYGLKSQIAWIDGESHSASRLILDELLPRARRGLEMRGIDAADIDRYLGIVERRTAESKTGSQWMLDSLAKMDPAAKPNVRLRTLTAAMVAHQKKGEPLHEWPLAEIEEKTDWIDNYRTVEQFMTRDLFTVRPEDAIELAVNLMDWRHIRHVPVEDENGALVGIVSHRDLLQLFSLNVPKSRDEIAVKNIMRRQLVTVPPETPTLDALRLMRDKRIGCLPVVRGERLVGIITDHDFLTVSTRLFEERLRAQDRGGRAMPDEWPDAGSRTG